MNREKLKKVAILAIEGDEGERAAARSILKAHGVTLGELLTSPKSASQNNPSLEEIISKNIDNLCNDFKDSFQKALIEFLKK